MVRRCVDAVELHRLVTNVDDVVPSPLRNDDCPVGGDLLGEGHLVLGRAISTRPRPDSRRRNWSSLVCTSRPTSPPTGMFITVTWNCSPVQMAVRKVSLSRVAFSISTTKGFGP